MFLFFHQLKSDTTVIIEADNIDYPDYYYSQVDPFGKVMLVNMKGHVSSTAFSSSLCRDMEHITIELLPGPGMLLVTFAYMCVCVLIVFICKI